MQELFISLAFNMLLIVMLALAMPFFIWGLKIFWGKLRYKSNASFLWIRSRKNNFTLPYVFDNSKESAKIKIGREVLTFPIKRDDVSKLTFIGMPLFIRDIEDATNEIGLVYRTKDGGYAVVKEPDYIHSDEMEIILNNQKLMSTVKTLLDNYQFLFMIVIGLLIAVLFNVYVSWELLSFINGFEFRGI